MDYLPAERPILIAQANESRAAERRQPVYRIVELGPIDQMVRLQDWQNAITFEQHLKLRDHLNPGQRIILAKPENANLPVLYIDQHKPYPVPTYQAFQSLLKLKIVDTLTEQQISSIGSILGDKADSKKFYRQAYLESMGGRTGVSMFFTRLSDSKTGRAFYFTADPKLRTIDEFGYEGAVQKKGNHWRTEADEMFRSVEFRKSTP
jgi:hypothetical protein